jgi:hypothetical protein
LNLSSVWRKCCRCQPNGLLRVTICNGKFIQEKSMTPQLRSKLKVALVLLSSGVTALFSSAAFANNLYGDVSLGGLITPGVYGQVNISNYPAPPVIYQQPVLIAPPPRQIAYQPVYMYVPPGHYKHWSRHCGGYNACSRPVYFVREGRGGGYGYDRGYRQHREHGEGHGRGHGKGHGRGHDRHDD